MIAPGARVEILSDNTTYTQGLLRGMAGIITDAHQITTQGRGALVLYHVEIDPDWLPATFGIKGWWYLAEELKPL